MSKLSKLIARRDKLQARLDKGLHLIDAAYAEGRDATALCEHFEKLLRQYEKLCDQIQRARQNRTKLDELEA